MQKQIMVEVNKWRHILKIVLNCVMFCATNNLALRGTHGNSTENNVNRGIFYNLIELVSKYDITLKTIFDKRTKGQVSYLSPKIQNEFIFLLASKVRNKIINNIKRAKYFSIIIDSTPDISHKEQVCQIIRYVKIENEMVTIEERFVDFVLSKCKTGQGLANEVLDKLKSDGLDFKNIRGQGYDNGANMAGILNGMQAHIARLNDLAKFVPCAAHSLNLIGVHAASITVEMVSFFGIIQKLFNFFASSTRRWEKITTLLKTTLKGHSDTRWCSKSRSVSHLKYQINEVIEVLKEISEYSSFGDGVATARIIIGYIESYNFIFMLIMWENILAKINVVNNQLQDKSQDIFRSSELLNGLVSFFQHFRNNQYDIIMFECKQKCEELGIDSTPKMKRKRKRKLLPGEREEGTILSSQDKLKHLFYEVVDNIIFQLGDRFKNTRSISSIFDFLNGKNLVTMPLVDLKKAAADCCIVYSELDAMQLVNELECFQSQAKIIFKNLISLHHLQILEGIVKWDLCESYPNISIALRIMLTLPVTVASGERSFSKLKIIKNYLRSTMSQDRLSSLSLLSIENDIFKETDFEDVIDEFANLKVRKVHLV
ncbi:LOW QUALITY PROTEIN: zinc finger MYM-type protein 1-like [Centruroides vittatus]|uniref:LOW QUALITY PROTEIN: zinc finger MYM-type protein 1-like n=1 Tax=Centruroides vittatus TaxID=120091 RepID=UPI00350EEB61